MNTMVLGKPRFASPLHRLVSNQVGAVNPSILRSEADRRDWNPG